MDAFQAERERAEKTRQAVGPFARAILTQTPQGTFAVPIEDNHVGLDLRFKGGFAHDELKRIGSLCNRETRLLVVGAHLGALAIPLAKVCQSVVAIEANPRTFELLQLNISMNGLTNCRAIHKAASNRVEMIQFVLNRTNTGGSKRTPIVKQWFYYHDNPETVTVAAAPLDELLSPEVFDVIVMDIEGSEYFALQGMPRILSSAKVLQIEFLPLHLKNVAAVSVEDFVSLISPHFSSLCISNTKAAIPREQFVSELQRMFEHNLGDDGLLFLKTPPENIRFA